MNDLVTRGMVRGLLLFKFDNEYLCAACECGKKSKKVYHVLLEKSISEPVELLHIELSVPSVVENHHH